MLSMIKAVGGSEHKACQQKRYAGIRGVYKCIYRRVLVPCSPPVDDLRLVVVDLPDGRIGHDFDRLTGLLSLPVLTK